MTDSSPCAPSLLHLARGVRHFSRVVAAGAGKHRHLAGGLFDHELDDAAPLVVRERRRLAGRAARHEKVHAAVDLTPREPLDARPHPPRRCA